MSNLGLMNYYLSIEVKQSENGICMSQGTYIQELVEKHGLENCNSVDVPMKPTLKLSKLDESGYANATEF